MSISGALTNAVSGLTASSRMAEIVSSNLSNALTDGYGRRAVELSAAQLGGKGAGVQIDGIIRSTNPGLLADRRLADAVLTGQQRHTESLTRLEESLGGVDGAASLTARFSAFERALISASSDPASQLRLTEAVSRLSDLTATLQAATRSTQSSRQQADAAIARDVDRLNTGLRQVADLNKDIQHVTFSGKDASALLDARQKAIDQIATIVPLREVPRDAGAVALITTTGVTLLDGRPVEFGFVQTTTIVADMTLESGALSGLTFGNMLINPTDGIGRLGGGSLGASFALRDDTLVGVQAGLDQIAVDLMTRFQDSTNDPTLIAGNPGLLTDQTNPLNMTDITGLAGRIAVNAAIDQSKGGNPGLLRDGLNATAPGPSGNSDQLNRWLGALSELRHDVTDSGARSAAARIADFTASIGAKRLSAEESVSLTAARWDSLRQAELADGVNTDVELQRLLRIEQAYAANSKVLQTVNAMMQRLLEI